MEAAPARSPWAQAAFRREAEAVAAAAQLVKAVGPPAARGRAGGSSPAALRSFAVNPQEAQAHAKSFERRRYNFAHGSGTDENTEPAQERERRMNSLAAGTVVPPQQWKEQFVQRSMQLLEVPEGSSAHTSPLADADRRLCAEAASVRCSLDGDYEQAPRPVVAGVSHGRGVARPLDLDSRHQASAGERPPVAKLSDMPEWAEAFQKRRTIVSNWSGSERGGPDEQSEPESSRNPSRARRPPARRRCAPSCGCAFSAR